MDERRTLLQDELRRRLGGLLTVLPSDQGLFLCTRLKRGSDIESASAAERVGLTLRALSPHYAHEAALQGFLLGFGGVARADIANSVARLSTLLAKITGGSELL